MDLENDFIRLHSCHINWKQETNQDWDDCVLQFDWQHALLTNAVRREDVVLDPETDDSWRDDPELEIMVQNLSLRRKDVEEMYESRAGRLYGLRFLTPSEYGNGKHFVPNLNQAKILDRTNNGPSLLFSNHSAADLRSAFWQWFFLFFDLITTLKHVRRND
jgi:hypothetical protein